LKLLAKSYDKKKRLESNFPSPLPQKEKAFSPRNLVPFSPRNCSPKEVTPFYTQT